MIRSHVNGLNAPLHRWWYSCSLVAVGFVDLPVGLHSGLGIGLVASQHSHAVAQLLEIYSSDSFRPVPTIGCGDFRKICGNFCDFRFQISEMFFLIPYLWILEQFSLFCILETQEDLGIVT